MVTETWKSLDSSLSCTHQSQSILRSCFNSPANMEPPSSLDQTTMVASHLVFCYLSQPRALLQPEESAPVSALLKILYWLSLLCDEVPNFWCESGGYKIHPLTFAALAQASSCFLGSTYSFLPTLQDFSCLRTFTHATPST
jgi:hypothetical protein